jgi:hypothetical protein
MDVPIARLSAIVVEMSGCMSDLSREEIGGLSSVCLDSWVLRKVVSVEVFVVVVAEVVLASAIDFVVFRAVVLALSDMWYTRSAFRKYRRKGNRD